MNTSPFVAVPKHLLRICLFLFMASTSASTNAAQSLVCRQDHLNRHSVEHSQLLSASTIVHCVDSAVSDELSDRAHQAMRVQVASHRNRSSELSLDLGSSQASPISVFLNLNTGFERSSERTALLFSISGAFVSVSHDSTKGSMTALGAGAVYRLYLSAKPGSLYLSGRAELMLCMESDESRTQEETALSIGPRFSQSIGYCFNNALNLEVGVYEQWLHKSLLLGSDVGISAGIAVRL